LPYFDEDFDFKFDNSSDNDLTYVPRIFLYGLPLPSVENSVVLLEYIVNIESVVKNNFRDIIPGELAKHDITPKDAINTAKSLEDT